MNNDAKNNVRYWTEEDEIKYREMLATPVKRLTEKEMLELAAVSPHPPLGASKKVTKQDIYLNKLAEMQKEKREIMESLKQATETPLFGNNDNFAQAITEAGIKAAKATHEFNMMEIKAKMLADITLELVRRSNGPIIPEIVTQMANKLVEQTVGKL